MPAARFAGKDIRSGGDVHLENATGEGDGTFIMMWLLPDRKSWLERRPAAELILMGIARPSEVCWLRASVFHGGLS